MDVTLLRLDKIVLDPTLTARAERPADLVRRYAEDMAAGHDFPPIVCFTDGAAVYVVDGWIRVLAAKLAGRKALEATVRTASRKEMRLHAAASNASHGTSRSQADRRLAVLIALEEQPGWTALHVAAHCKVSPALVTGIIAVRARMPEARAEDAAAKSPRETLGVPAKPAPPKPAFPRPVPPPKVSSAKPAAPTPPPKPANPWDGVLDGRRDDDFEPDEKDAEEEAEPADEDEGDEEISAKQTYERMLRSGRKFLRYVDLVGLEDAEAVVRVRSDMCQKSIVAALRGRPEKRPASPSVVLNGSREEAVR
jgi:hypothetical protein